MTERIKLTEEDFAVWSNMGEEHVPVIIKTQIKCDPQQLKQQILGDNYFIIELGDGWKDIIKFVRETKRENKQLKEYQQYLLKLTGADVDKIEEDNKNLKQKLEKIKKVFMSSYDVEKRLSIIKEILEDKDA